MTPEEIKRKREQDAANAEMAIFDQLSSRLRDELNRTSNLPSPVGRACSAPARRHRSPNHRTSNTES